MNRNTMTHLKQRLTLSSFGILLLLIAIYFSFHPLFQFLFVSLVAAVLSCALWEYYHLAKIQGSTPLSSLGIGGTILYVFAVFIDVQQPDIQGLPEAVLFSLLFLLFVTYFFKGTHPLSNLAVTFFGIVYITVPLSCTIAINYAFPVGGAQDGRWWLFYLLTLTTMTDTGAYFIGKEMGKRPLAPNISPKKTIEGAIGGLFIAVATSILFDFCVTSLFPQKPLELSFWQSIVFGILLGIAAQIGDLAESLIKRDAGVKDSSHIPGLGGFLDVVDSLIFTAPLICFFLKSQQGTL